MILKNSALNPKPGEGRSVGLALEGRELLLRNAFASIAVNFIGNKNYLLQFLMFAAMGCPSSKSMFNFIYFSLCVCLIFIVNVV